MFRSTTNLVFADGLGSSTVPEGAALTDEMAPLSASLPTRFRTVASPRPAALAENSITTLWTSAGIATRVVEPAVTSDTSLPTGKIKRKDPTAVEATERYPAAAVLMTRWRSGSSE